jgi:hypothetical protein
MESRSEEILELLRTKNRCLDRLMAETRAFLAVSPEKLVDEAGSDTGPLALYEEARRAILKTLELHDSRIGDLIAGLPASARTPEFIALVREEMHRNERLIISIFNADDVVFRKIAQAQAQITKLIQENRKSRDLLGKFKSVPAATGEEMDTTL